jgi:L-ascorbate metabolism protein UlaG (beta-lactamase superfamily)
VTIAICPNRRLHALRIAEANRASVADRLKIDPEIPTGVDDGTSVEISGIRFSGIASAHETVQRDEHSRAKYLGYVHEFGGWTIYHSGDTVRYEGVAEKLRSFRTDVALLPISGRAPERRVPGNLFGREAAQLAKDMDAKLVIPVPFRNVRIQ